MGNRHGSMGVTINYDADLQASVETASVDKAMDIEADLKDKLQSKIKENEGVEATVTVDLDYYDKVDEVATFNVNIQFEDEGTVKFAEFDGDYYQPPDADDLIHEERDLEGIIDEAMADLGYPDATQKSLLTGQMTWTKFLKKLMNHTIIRNMMKSNLTLIKQ